MDHPLTCIIVDDESKARKVLRHLCEEFCPEINILGEASSAQEAREIISKKTPDFIFLDIRMPMEDGFKFLDSVDTQPFKVIFTTAYDQYAVQAFKFAAVDYLLKPIDIDELTRAVGKIKKQKEKAEKQKQAEKNTFQLPKIHPEKISLPTSDGFIFTSPKRISRCEAYGNYTKVYHSEEKPSLITKPLRHMEEILSPQGFMRIHKSHLVNTHKIRRFVKGKSAKVVMMDGTEVEVSVRKREELIERLGNVQ